MRTDSDHSHQTGPLYVLLFGRFRVYDDCGAEIDIPSRHARALFPMLSIAQERLERDFVSKIRWPGRFPSQAKASLRQCIFELSRHLKRHRDDPLEVTHATVALRPGAIVTDFDTLVARLGEDDPIAAVESLDQAGRLKLLAPCKIKFFLASQISSITSSSACSRNRSSIACSTP